MSADPVVVLAVLAGGTYVLKATGPVLLGGDRRLPTWLEQAALLLPAPLLAALVVTSSVVDERTLMVDARLVGLAAAAVALWQRAPFIVVVVCAAAATALFRAVT